MQEIQLTVSVKTNADTTPDGIRRIVKRLINVGYEDAAMIIENGDGDLNEAQIASALHISVEVATPKRCLIIVRGGVADYVNDDGVQVEVFDWDNYEDDAEATGVVSKEFADLANFCGAPVEGE